MAKTTMSYPRFYEMLAARIAGLDIKDAWSINVAQRILEDSQTWLPANHILGIAKSLNDLMVNVRNSESPYVGHVLSLLEQADDCIKTQIVGYRDGNDLSDEQIDATNRMMIGAEDGLFGEDVGMTNAHQAQSTRRLNGADDPLGR